MSEEQLKKDYETLNIIDIENISVRFVTGKYKRLAKQRHPDKEGGTKVDFQELQAAYKRVITHLERTQGKKEDYERDFFMANNVCKECTVSCVVYIRNSECKAWKTVLGKHLSIHKGDKKRIIFKTGKFTVTLYDTPKVDPRSKIHVQSGDQRANIEFIMDQLSSMYQEVAQLQDKPLIELQMKSMEKSICLECGENFTSKKGLKQHVMRMHVQKPIKQMYPLH